MSAEQDTAMYDQPDDDKLNADAEREAEFWRTHERDDAGSELSGMAIAWDEGAAAGYDHAANEHTPSGASIDPPVNPYLPPAIPII